MEIEPREIDDAARAAGWERAGDAKRSSSRWETGSKRKQRGRGGCEDGAGAEWRRGKDEKGTEKCQRFEWGEIAIQSAHSLSTHELERAHLGVSRHTNLR